jgi:hypothetical protein
MRPRGTGIGTLNHFVLPRILCIYQTFSKNKAALWWSIVARARRIQKAVGIFWALLTEASLSRNSVC